MCHNISAVYRAVPQAEAQLQLRDRLEKTAKMLKFVKVVKLDGCRLLGWDAHFATVVIADRPLLPIPFFEFEPKKTGWLFLLTIPQDGQLFTRGKSQKLTAGIMFSIFKNY